MIALFDIGSTLIDGPPYGPARRLAEMLGLDKSAARTLEPLLFRTPSLNSAHLAEQISVAVHVPLERVKEECAKLWDAQLSEAFVLPGALEAVARLEAAGVPRAYLSNIWPPFYEHFRRSFTTEAEAPQFLSFRMGLSKPDRAFFEAALRELKAQPKDVVMIGDTYKNDILPAIDLGMRTVWVLHRPEKERESLVEVLNGSAPKPDVTLHSIADLEPGHLK
jgi:HAD superfamily hydrolase (TIGR01549 family)